MSTIRLVAMRSHLSTWKAPAWGAWLFGSAARGDGDENSDIDVLIVRDDTVADTDPAWLEKAGWYAPGGTIHRKTAPTKSSR